MDQAIIFCRTKLDCDNIENYLQSLGGGQDTLRILSVYSRYTIITVGPKSVVNEYSCVCLHGDRRPQERKDNLQKFKVQQNLLIFSAILIFVKILILSPITLQEGEVRFLICTDVAARGIDITGIPYVVNVTLPDDKQNYVHRIGRVGRAERMGLAISLVSKVKEKASLTTWHSAGIKFGVWYLLPFKDILWIKKISTFLSFYVFCIPQILNMQNNKFNCSL